MEDMLPLLSLNKIIALVYSRVHYVA